MPDELSELQENAEHGRENPSLRPHFRHDGHPRRVRGRRFVAGAQVAYRGTPDAESRDRSVGVLPGEKYSPP